MAQEPQGKPRDNPLDNAPTGGDTVVVGCKLPHGIVLQACTMVETDEPMRDGSRRVMKAHRLPETFTVAGNSYPEGGALRARIEYGFALTYGVPRKLWEAWLKDNKDTPMVKNGLIFAHGSDRSTTAEAREKEKVRSGFERLDPTRLPGALKKAEAVAA